MLTAEAFVSISVFVSVSFKILIYFVMFRGFSDQFISSTHCIFRPRLHLVAMSLTVMDMDCRGPWRTCRETGLISHFAGSVFVFCSQYEYLLMAHAFFHIFLLTSGNLQGQNGITLPF